MKYMFLIYGAENSWTEDERNACMIESIGIGQQLAAQGKYVASAPLQSVATAATIRVRDGRPLVTDGPYAETTEQLGGFYLLDLTDLDEAIAVACRLPPAKKGTVEIRPVLAMEGLPEAQPLPENATETPYMLLCCHNEARWNEAGPVAQQEARTEARALAHDLQRNGRYLDASPLHPPATATCVRVRDGKRIITDGPFAETHEVLGGFYLFLAESRAAAIAAGARQPGARFGAVEVRPLFDLSALRSSLGNL
ncbi:MAG TPA: YciI family protein [Gemmataceae bacterium]|jgi:hypothetical protein|nr:YciI family protein [Gemmataceae bacterium]